MKHFQMNRKAAVKAVAVKLALLMLLQVAFPTITFALTGGPSQPEVESFEPIGTSEMVDLFSGDFTYNIPLLDVEGYPVNLSYHSGITMDQEASWVGLGWNVNAGVINRGLRGLPDDFNSDQVTTEYNMKENKTVGVTASASFSKELIGYQLPDLSILNASLSVSLGIKYNNYTGWGSSIGVTPGINAGEAAKLQGNVGLGISASSDEGSSLSPKAGLPSISKSAHKPDFSSKGSLNIAVGGSFNSRSGWQSLSVNMHVNYSRAPKRDGGRRNRSGKVGVNLSAIYDMGPSTYSPSSEMDYRNFGFTGTFSVGAEIAPLHTPVSLTGYVSRQYLTKKSTTAPAFGYLNSQHGQYNNTALLDFNRENQGGFSENTPALNLTNHTYDIFSVSGQGVGGSYRAFRSDIGTVQSPSLHGTPDDNYTLEIELGAISVAKLGGSLGFSRSNSYGGEWQEDYNVADKLQFTKDGSSGSPLYEGSYFKEAGEMNVESNNGLFDRVGGSHPVRVATKKNSKFEFSTNNKFIDENYHEYPLDNIKKVNRDKRNQLFSYLMKSEVAKFGVMGESYYTAQPARPGHHITEITTLGTDGNRYVYALPAYNNDQEEVTFAVGKPIDVSGSVEDINWYNGMIDYAQFPSDVASTNNRRGIDNYYNGTKTPPYAHSYMLSTVLSSDYVDSDNVRGPSANDFGNYTVFNYDIKKDYKWRAPFEYKKANYNEGLKSDQHDDKASFTYGSKDLCYLKTIETRNYVAVFTTKPRRDGRGVDGRDGGMCSQQYTEGNNSNGYMFYLDNIKLFTRSEYEKYLLDNENGIPIKTVTFKYNYSLCEGVPNFQGGNNPLFDNPENPIGPGTGKLTLTGVEFTYQNSRKAKLSAYTFDYSNINPTYNAKSIDRWGMFKRNVETGGYVSPTANLFPNGEYPYTQQSLDPNVYTEENPDNDMENLPGYKNDPNRNARAWHMTKIKLPSGGVIQVDYESDTYSAVQNKGAMKMTPIVDVRPLGTQATATTSPVKRFLSENNNDENSAEKNGLLYFKRDLNPETGQYYASNEYIYPGEQLFYKALVVFNFLDENTNSEYIPGYADVEAVGDVPGSDLGWIKLQGVGMKDKPDDGNDIWADKIWSPICRSALQFGRMNLKKVVYSNNIELGDGEGEGLKNALLAIVDAVSSIKELFSSPNKYLYNKEPNFPGRTIITLKSQMRLRIPSGLKYGGGSRVKQITISDKMNDVTGRIETNNDGVGESYGQIYSYETMDGRTSGVASYEPQIGGEENPWKTAKFGSLDYQGVPDERFFQETPYGESFFPSASVGYARVVVKNLPHTGVTKHATGFVEHEFYTSNQFPTIVKQTKIEPLHGKHKPHGLKGLLKLNVKDFVTVSQGFVIETNDMNGKPKSEKVYAENGSIPISSVEYKYRSETVDDRDILATYSKLKNNCTIINKDGQVDENAQLGVVYDIINDQQESWTETWSAELKGNMDFTPFFGIMLPSVWPSKSMETTQFRSITTTKVVQRFGILEETIAQQDGSVVSTKNLAYDAETGQVLLTQTKTDYNDEVYNMNYPAYWYYREMGPAYQNIGLERPLHFDASGTAPVENAPMYYANGDELALYGPNTAEKYWVTEVTPYNIKVMDRLGGAPPVVSGDYNTKVLRSGFRNMQLGAMANIVTRINPLHNIRTNIYDMILQASAIEYTNEWPTACNCMNGDDNTATNNPYIRGTRGYWKPSKSFLHLAGRTQSDINGNTNLRNDGFFTSYSPFYKVDEFGNWAKDYDNWTYTSEVSIFSPYGPELENRDALGRYSSANFGFHQTLPTAVAANSRYGEMGFESFEDYIMSGVLPTLPCNNQKFRLVNLGDESESDAELVSNVSHTGRYSLKLDGKLAQDFPQPSPCVGGPCEMTVEIVQNPLSNYVTLLVTGGSGNYTPIMTTVSGFIGTYSINDSDPNTYTILLGGNSDWLAHILITDENGNTFNHIIGND
jgi:hypothetical protein